MSNNTFYSMIALFCYGLGLLVGICSTIGYYESEKDEKPTLKEAHHE